MPIIYNAAGALKIWRPGYSTSRTQGEWNGLPHGEEGIHKHTLFKTIYKG